MKKAKVFFLAAGVFALVAGFFKFALAGYGFAALFFLLLAAAGGFYGLSFALEARRPKLWRRLRLALTLCICLYAALLVAVEIPIVAASRGEKEPEADYLIVLGAGVNGREPSRSLQDRLEAALHYLEAYPAAKCVLSGGQGPGEEISEAACMADWLTERGIAAERLLLEDRAENTRENLAFSKAMIPEGASIALLTSEYHLCRAKYLAAEQGMEVLGVPAETSLPVLKLNYFFREAFAMVELWLLG